MAVLRVDDFELVPGLYYVWRVRVRAFLSHLCRTSIAAPTHANANTHVCRGCDPTLAVLQLTRPCTASSLPPSATSSTTLIGQRNTTPSLEPGPWHTTRKCWGKKCFVGPVVYLSFLSSLVLPSLPVVPLLPCTDTKELTTRSCHTSHFSPLRICHPFSLTFPRSPMRIDRSSVVA